MSNKSVAQFLLIFAILCWPSPAAAQDPEATPAPVGHSIITGRVVYADTGRPVRRATVMLYDDLKRGPAKLTPANVSGEFRFTGVVAGSYFVVAEAAGIISPLSAFTIGELGIGGHHEADYTRVTVDGKNASRCEVKAVRAGTIKGTITYDDKEPVVNGRVVVYRRKGEAVAPFFVVPVLTNDRGMYRLDGLPDGEYFVGVANGQMLAAAVATNPREVSLVNGFYPGVRSLAEAKPVQVRSGSEVTDVNITLNDDVLREISGIVKWRGSNEPIAEGALSVRRKNDPMVDVSFPNFLRFGTAQEDDDYLMASLPLIMMTMPLTTKVNEKGEWTFKDLPPGLYVITAFAQLREPADAPQKSKERDPALPPPIEEERRFVSRQVEVTVEEEDVKDIKIELSDGGRILGVVVGEDSGPTVMVSISVNQKGVDPFILNMPRESQPDGTFMIDGVAAGEVLLDVDVPPGAPLYLKSITAGSQDLMREPLRMQEGGEVTGIRIMLGMGLATLSGRVQSSEGGTPAAGAGVLLVRADPALWHLQSLRLFATTDPNGAFTLQGPPGEYLLFTWDVRNRPLQKIEDFVRSQAANARRITLLSKEEKQIELTTKGTKETKGTKDF